MGRSAWSFLPKMKIISHNKHAEKAVVMLTTLHLDRRVSDNLAHLLKGLAKGSNLPKVCSIGYIWNRVNPVLQNLK